MKKFDKENEMKNACTVESIKLSLGAGALEFAAVRGDVYAKIVKLREDHGIALEQALDIIEKEYGAGWRQYIEWDFARLAVAA